MRLRYQLLLLSWVGFYSITLAQPRTDRFLTNLFKNNPGTVLYKVTQQPKTYRCQIIYTQINRDKNNIPHFTNYYFNYDSLLYFNPASTVKLPLAALALEKLHRLNSKGITKFTTIQYDSAYPGQKKAYTDSTAANGLPSIAHYIKRAFLISENDPYNRFYQWIGQQAINNNLHQKGYTDVRISRQFMGFTEDQNRHTNPVHFIDSQGQVLYRQPAAYNTDSFDFSHINKLGTGYYNSHDSLINGPFDFTTHNNLSLYDLQQILQSLLFPASVPLRQRFDLSSTDYRYLYQYLSQYPSETNYPYYDTSLFYDSYVKFFFRDSTHHMPPGIRVFNKVGWAYGFLTDISYVADFKNKIEYMLAATVYVNSDSILNDNTYDYDEVGHPFMRQLGQAIYQYERQRKRPHTPDLSRFAFTYEARNANDSRPMIKEVDN